MPPPTPRRWGRNLIRFKLRKYRDRLSTMSSGSISAPAAIPDLVAQAIPEDDRLWVPQAPQIWFRPLLLNTVQGEWVNLLKVRRAGVLSRHRHPAPVHGYVIKGSWRYLE